MKRRAGGNWSPHEHSDMRGAAVPHVAPLMRATMPLTKTASIGGLYPPFAVTLLALCRIDFAAGLRGLLYRRKSGPLTRRAFALSRLR
jgi:hypothetical protein